MGRGYVRNSFVQMIAADRLDRVRLLTDERENHRKIVRRKAPQDVFLAANFSEIETIRIEILQPSETALAHQLLELQKCRVILQQVPDHQPAIKALSKRHELFGLGETAGERLLDKNML